MRLGPYDIYICAETNTNHEDSGCSKLKCGSRLLAQLLFGRETPLNGGRMHTSRATGPWSRTLVLDAEFISPKKCTLSVLYWVMVSPKKCKVYPLSYEGVM